MALTNQEARDQWLQMKARAAMGSPQFAILVQSDTVNLDKVPRAIMVSANGNVKMIGAMATDAAAGVVVPLLAGVMYDICPRQVLDTGTDAIDVIGFF